MTQERWKEKKERMDGCKKLRRELREHRNRGKKDRKTTRKKDKQQEAKFRLG